MSWSDMWPGGTGAWNASATWHQESPVPHGTCLSLFPFIREHSRSPQKGGVSYLASGQDWERARLSLIGLLSDLTTW